jgi:hypothetical protein
MIKIYDIYKEMCEGIRLDGENKYEINYQEDFLL